MAGKKSQRIAELEREVARLEATLAKREDTIARQALIIARPAPRPSLADTAKREWQQFTDRILGAVGL